METLSSLEAFVRSAERGSFSSAARALARTPAAVSKSVAKLEDSLGVRLFHRTTRKLSLTDVGQALFADASRGLGTLDEALQRASSARREPTGVFKLSLGPAFGRDYVLPVLASYLAACPRVTPDWRYENRQVDLVAEGYDAAVGTGYELSSGLVARELARIHIVAVCAPSYLAKRAAPKTIEELESHEIVAFRTSRTGKLRTWTMQNDKGREVVCDPPARVIANDVDGLVTTTRLGHGIALAPTSQVLVDLERGSLVRVLPRWYADAGPVYVYFASQRHLPQKTRVFVDLLVAHFQKEKLAQRFRADR